MTPKSHLINICALNDPKTRSSWPGTPYKIYVALNHRLRCGEAFGASLPFGIENVLGLLSMAVHGRVDTSRAPLRRYMRAVRTMIRTARASSSHTIHVGALSLPFPIRPRNQAHYLLCETTWDLESTYSTEAHAYSDRIHNMYDWLDRTAYKQVDHIFSISNYVKENLVDHYDVHPDKVTVVGTGMGTVQPFHGHKDYTERKILFAAKDGFVEKGGLLAIEAFNEAVQADPSLQLTIVGSEEAKQYATHPNITVHGFVGVDKLQELFNTHTVFLMPAFNEPWGLVYLEAMACKMPIIGLNRNGFPELSGYGKYGFMIDEVNPKRMADKLIEILQSPSSLQLMGERAQTHCLENYTWDNTVSRMLNIIIPELSYA